MTRPIMICGRAPHVASAAQTFTMDEARDVAQEVARTLTEAWSRDGKA
jgi:hypothetical protein